MVYSNWKNHAKGSKSFIIIVSNFHSHETNQREPTVFFFFWFFFLVFFFVFFFCCCFFFLSFFLFFKGYSFGIPEIQQFENGSYRINNNALEDTQMCLNIGTPKNNEFLICPKWKIYYF